MTDPLVLNIAGGNVTTTPLGVNGISFDMRGDGGQESTGWISSGEGFLVLDKDGSGVTTDSRSMISDLQELTGYDTNGDGVISNLDTNFNKLEIWVPSSDASQGAYYSLADLGITGIDLSSSVAVDSSNNGNLIKSTFTFTYNSGLIGEGADINFALGVEHGKVFQFAEGEGPAAISRIALGDRTDSSLTFGAGIDPTSISVTGDTQGDLILALGDSDAITLQGALTIIPTSYGIQTLTFSDGTSWSFSQLLAKETTGSASGNQLYGTLGADTFDGRGGNDLEVGNGGGDSFVFKSGYGKLEINEVDPGPTPNNVLQMGVSAFDLGAELGGTQHNDVVLTDSVSSDQITIDNMSSGNQYGVQDVKLADGTDWTAQQILQLATNGSAASETITGTSAADLLDGKGGTDTLVGVGGDDTYLFRSGYGSLTIDNGSSTDSAAEGELLLGPEVSATNLWFTKSGSDLQINVLGTQDQITVQGWFSNNASAQLAEIKTSDGLELDQGISQLISAMSTFATNTPGFDIQSVLQMPSDKSLQSAIAASWHH